MDTVIVSSSRSPHGNTQRVADAIADVFDGPVLNPAQVTPEVLANAARVGFGSGIYWWRFDSQLVEMIQSLPAMTGRDAFVFATSGLPEPPFRRYSRTLGRLLEAKGFRVVGTFMCRGVDTWGPFRAVGGVSKNRPSDNDLVAARNFATRIIDDRSADGSGSRPG